MKRLFYTLMILLLVASTHAQRRKVDIKEFSGIDLAIPGTLYIKQGDDTSVEIICTDEAMEKIEFEMRGDRLKIKNRERNWSGWKDNDLRNTKIYVTMKDITRVGVSGSGEVYGESSLNTDNLDVSVSGSGGLELDINATDLDVSISGSGRLKLSGSGEDMDLKISGSGSLMGADLKVISLDASISGSGKCEIEVSERIEAKISGSGNIYYKGSPESIQSNSSGSGKVRRY